MLQSPAARPFARDVKYIANKPAKNMSSWARNAIVPTLTMFGRFSVGTRFCGVAISWFVIAVVTEEIIPYLALIFISLTPVISL